MLAQRFAVIRRVDDDRILRHPRLVERVQQPAYLVVQIGY